MEFLVDELLTIPEIDENDNIPAACSGNNVPHNVHTFTPLQIIGNGDNEFLQQYIKYNNIDAKDKHTGRSLLHEACVGGKRDIVQFILTETNANISLCTSLGRSTPLHLAVSTNHEAVVILLLSHGADPCIRDRFGCTPMHYVKSLTIAKLLVQYGAYALDTNLKNSPRRKTVLESVKKSFEHEDDKVKYSNCDKLIEYLQQQAHAEYKPRVALFRQKNKKIILHSKMVL